MKLSFSSLLLTLLGIIYVAIVHSSTPTSLLNGLQTENHPNDITAKCKVRHLINCY